MPKSINGCPYKASYNGQCTHKNGVILKSKKRYCEYEYPHNCDMFRNWLSEKEKSNSIPINHPQTAKEKQHD